MSINTPQQIAEITIEAGVKKSHLPALSILVLGFLAGAFIALGFLLDIHVSTMIPGAWASLGNLLARRCFRLA
jgi:formate/nitrite transporter FocA (FNT family)